MCTLFKKGCVGYSAWAFMWRAACRFLLVQNCMTLQMFCGFLCLSFLQDTLSPFHYSEAGQASVSSLGFIILCCYGKTQITGHTHILSLLQGYLTEWLQAVLLFAALKCLLRKIRNILYLFICLKHLHIIKNSYHISTVWAASVQKC